MRQFAEKIGFVDPDRKIVSAKNFNEVITEMTPMEKQLFGEIKTSLGLNDLTAAQMVWDLSHYDQCTPEDQKLIAKKLNSYKFIWDNKDDEKGQVYLLSRIMSIAISRKVTMHLHNDFSSNPKSKQKFINAEYISSLINWLYDSKSGNNYDWIKGRQHQDLTDFRNVLYYLQYVPAISGIDGHGSNNLRDQLLVKLGLVSFNSVGKISTFSQRWIDEVLLKRPPSNIGFEKNSKNHFYEILYGANKVQKYLKAEISKSEYEANWNGKLCSELSYSQKLFAEDIMESEMKLKQPESRTGGKVNQLYWRNIFEKVNPSTDPEILTLKNFILKSYSLYNKIHAIGLANSYVQPSEIWDTNKQSSSFTYEYSYKILSSIMGISGSDPIFMRSLGWHSSVPVMYEMGYQIFKKNNELYDGFEYIDKLDNIDGRKFTGALGYRLEGTGNFGILFYTNANFLKSFDKSKYDEPKYLALESLLSLLEFKTSANTFSSVSIQTATGGNLETTISDYAKLKDFAIIKCKKSEISNELSEYASGNGIIFTSKLEKELDSDWELNSLYYSQISEWSKEIKVNIVDNAGKIISAETVYIIDPEFMELGFAEFFKDLANQDNFYEANYLKARRDLGNEMEKEGFINLIKSWHKNGKITKRFTGRRLSEKEVVNIFTDILDISTDYKHIISNIDDYHKKIRIIDPELLAANFNPDGSSILKYSGPDDRFRIQNDKISSYGSTIVVEEALGYKDAEYLGGVVQKVRRALLQGKPMHLIVPDGFKQLYMSVLLKEGCPIPVYSLTEYRMITKVKYEIVKDIRDKIKNDPLISYDDAVQYTKIIWNNFDFIKFMQGAKLVDCITKDVYTNVALYDGLSINPVESESTLMTMLGNDLKNLEFNENFYKSVFDTSSMQTSYKDYSNFEKAVLAQLREDVEFCPISNFKPIYWKGIDGTKYFCKDFLAAASLHLINSDGYINTGNNGKVDLSNRLKDILGNEGFIRIANQLSGYFIKDGNPAKTKYYAFVQYWNGLTLDKEGFMDEYNKVKGKYSSEQLEAFEKCFSESEDTIIFSQMEILEKKSNTGENGEILLPTNQYGIEQYIKSVNMEQLDDNVEFFYLVNKNTLHQKLGGFETATFIKHSTQFFGSEWSKNPLNKLIANNDLGITENNVPITGVFEFGDEGIINKPQHFISFENMCPTGGSFLLFLHPEHVLPSHN